MLKAAYLHGLKVKFGFDNHHHHQLFSYLHRTYITTCLLPVRPQAWSTRVDFEPGILTHHGVCHLGFKFLKIHFFGAPTL